MKSFDNKQQHNAITVHRLVSLSPLLGTLWVQTKQVIHFIGVDGCRHILIKEESQSFADSFHQSCTIVFVAYQSKEI